MTGFQRLSLVTCAVIFGLIVLGGVVRASESGLGCPDWPRCHGSLIPRWEKHTLIEYSHRLTASVAGVLVLSMAVIAWRSFKRIPGVLYPSLLALGLIVFQAGLGGAAVLNELPPEIVALHLGTALAVLALVALVAIAAFALERPPPRADTRRDFRRVALLALATTFGLMIAGSYVAGAGYGLGCSGWPLCNGEVVPGTNAASAQVVFLHRFLALALGVMLVALAWLGWQRRAAAPFAAYTAVAALGVLALQSLVGAANVWTRLASEVSALHLALASLLWLLLAVLNIYVYRAYNLLPARDAAAARRDLAGAAR